MENPGGLRISADYAPLYRFLARAFLRPPDAEMLELASELLGSPYLTVDAQQHTWLFEFNVYPYASVYLDPSGMLNAPWSGFVAGVYKALALDVSLADLAAPDHLSAQLEVLATLLERETSASKLEAERARHAQKTFLAEHLLPWLPTFSFAVERLDDGLYAGLAAATRDLAAEHLEDLFGGEPVPAFVLPTDNEVPREEARAREELTKFFLPARSGLFLSREDIMRLGRALQVPARFAERSFMLEQLALAAADAEKLKRFFLELKAEAERHLAQLRALQQARPSLSPLWEAQCERLAASAEKLARLERELSA